MMLPSPDRCRSPAPRANQDAGANALRHARHRCHRSFRRPPAQTGSVSCPPPAVRLPTPSAVRRLVEVLGRTEYPTLHPCREGVDRTGLAGGSVKLLHPAVTLCEARRQLSISYDHVPFNGTENMDRFLDLYAE